MKAEEKREYIQYRLESARKTFDAAMVLAENGFWNSAVNERYQLNNLDNLQSKLEKYHPLEQ